MKIENEQEKQSFSFTWAAFAGMIVAFIVFGLMFHLVVVPINEDTNARIQAITFNESQFNALKSDFEALKNETEGRQMKMYENLFEIQLKTKILWDEKGEWECTKWKQYDDLDCKILFSSRNASIIENTTTCLWSYNERSGRYIFPDFCEQWRYGR